MESNIKYKTQISKKLKSSNMKNLTKNIHKIYFGIAILFGLIFSIGMPFFNEPDGPYHFVVSSNMVGLTPDISKYGEFTVGSGMANQADSYNNGTRFEKYYLTKIQLTSKSKLPRDFSLSPLSYDFWGHLIPAVGVWMGYHIYPSMGVMITVGRLFSMLFYTIITFFIIKNVKRNKLLFTAVLLSPTVLNQNSSLSYDSLGYILFAGLLSILINALDENKIRVKGLILAIILSILSIVGTKQNIWVLLIIFPIVLFSIKNPLSKYQIKSITKPINLIKQNKKVQIGLLLLSLAIIIKISISLTSKFGGIIHVARRFFMTFIHQYGDNLTTASIWRSWLTSPYAFYNRMPTWSVVAWNVLIILLLLYEVKYVRSKFVSVSAAVLFVLGIIATYYGFLNYGTGTSSFIQGLQGRYFTATLLILGLAVSNKSFRLKVVGSEKYIVGFSFSLIVVTNIMLIFNTLITLILGG